MDYLPIVDGRRCVPVRLLPYLTDWSPLSPDIVASLFAHEHAFLKWDLQSYLLEASGKYEALPYWRWEYRAISLEKLQRDLQDQPDDEWNRRSIEALPARVFVWLDDLLATIGPGAAKTPGDWHRGLPEEEGMPDDWPPGMSEVAQMFDDWRRRLPDENGTPGKWRGKRSDAAKMPDQWRRELAFSPMWSDAERRTAMEGFELVTASAPVAAAAPVSAEPEGSKVAAAGLLNDAHRELAGKGHQVACLTAVMVADSPAPTLDAQAEPAPSQAQARIYRQDARLAMCESMGLVFDESARLPDGVGNAASKLGITRQSLSADLKSAVGRRTESRKNGSR